MQISAWFVNLFHHMIPYHNLQAKRDNLKEPLEDVFRELVKLKHSA